MHGVEKHRFEYMHPQQCRLPAAAADDVSADGGLEADRMRVHKLVRE